MDIQTQSKIVNPVVRQLASLKVLSRLLGHELHVQGGSKTIQLSREEVVEIQTTVDLFIEEISRRQGAASSPGAASPGSVGEPQLVTARN
jgi:hypothetical protein